MSRTGYVKYGVFFELMKVPDIGIMIRAYGKRSDHTCGECRHRIFVAFKSPPSGHTCAKLKPDSEIRCEAVTPACGKFEKKEA